MSIPHWDDNAPLWDTLTIGQWVMPGIWTVDFSLRRELDVKKAPSTDGASLKDKGYQPPLLTLRGKLIERDDWQRLQDIMPHIHPKRKGGARTPYRVSHPKTTLVGIDSIYIHEIDAVELENGVLTIELRAYEHAKPKPVKVKPLVYNQGVTFVSRTEPPPSIARYPATRGILIDGSDPVDVLVEPEGPLNFPPL